MLLDAECRMLGLARIIPPQKKNDAQLLMAGRWDPFHLSATLVGASVPPIPLGSPGGLATTPALLM